MNDTERLITICHRMATDGGLTQLSIPRLRSPSLVRSHGGMQDRDLAPRLFVALRGVRRYRDWHAAEQKEVVLRPREALYLVPGKCVGEVYADAGEVLAMTLMPDCLRVARIVCTAPGEPTASPSERRRLAPLLIAPGPPGPQIDHLTGLLALLRPEQLPESGVILCRVLLRLVAERLEQPAEAVAGKAESTWLMLQAYLSEHLAAALSRETVGRALGVHPNHLSRLCRRFAGATFTETLTVIRLQRAAHLMIHSSRGIAEIGYDCGFRQPSYFTVQFSAYYGRTPSAWRAIQLAPTNVVPGDRR